MRRLEWDSEHFGVAIGRVDGDAPLEVEIAEARAEGLACLYAFPAGDDLEAIARAVGAGGRLVDLRLDLSGPGDASAPVGVRRATDADLEDVERAAVALAAYSRFSRDARFPRDRVDEMYRIWARRLLVEGIVVVPESGAGGLVAASTADGEARLDLVYVEPGVSGKGLGAALIGAALAEAGLPRARVATQAGNVPALRLYESLGFRAWSLEAVVHLWLDELA